MTSPHPRASAADVPLLSVSGQLQLSEPYFDRIRQVVTDAINARFEMWQAELKASGQSKGDASSERSTAPKLGVDVPTEQSALATAARTSSGIELGLKAGQGMIDARTVAGYLNISQRALYRLMATHSVPMPVSLGGRMKRWLLEEILAWSYAGCPNQERWARMRILAIREFRTWTTSSKK